MLDLRVLRHLLARLQADICLLPVRSVAGETSAAPKLAEVVDGLYIRHFHAEYLLDCGFDLGFVRVRGYFEAQGVGFVLPGHGLFRDDGTANYIVNVHTASASESFRAAASDIRTCLWA